ncbi:hypothetical protein ACJX0J_027991 [Zea mays]
MHTEVKAQVGGNNPLLAAYKLFIIFFSFGIDITCHFFTPCLIYFPLPNSFDTKSEKVFHLWKVHISKVAVPVVLAGSLSIPSFFIYFILSLFIYFIIVFLGLAFISFISVPWPINHFVSISCISDYSLEHVCCILEITFIL